ncbi:hypothetical protein RIF29_16846 [Crotalaria pallida]|uniref:Uncharacterized protein n=1 Tax=Crotalaria pallida TaxID=3830 RepID=A0AAN9IEU1_CROPI
MMEKKKERRRRRKKDGEEERNIKEKEMKNRDEKNEGRRMRKKRVEEEGAKKNREKMKRNEVTEETQERGRSCDGGIKLMTRCEDVGVLKARPKAAVRVSDALAAAKSGRREGGERKERKGGEGHVPRGKRFETTTCGP